MLVASDSSIHLECTMMNIPSIYFNLNKGQTIDYYGFCKNGLVKSAADLVDIEKSIKFYNSADNSKLYKSAKYYCNSLENDVSAVQLAIDQIDKILNKA